MKMKYIMEKLKHGIFEKTIYLCMLAGVLLFVIAQCMNMITESFIILFAFIILGFILEYVYYNPIGKIFKINNKDKTIHMRGIRIDKIYNITDNTSIEDANKILKNNLPNEIKTLYKYIKKHKISFFKTKTHSFFYKELLEVLKADPDLKFEYSPEDIKAIENLQLQDEPYSIKSKDNNCTVTFRLLEKNKEITERAFIFPYKKLITATTDELNKIVIKRDEYIVTVHITCQN